MSPGTQAPVEVSLGQRLRLVGMLRAAWTGVLLSTALLCRPGSLPDAQAVVGLTLGVPCLHPFRFFTGFIFLGSGNHTQGLCLPGRCCAPSHSSPLPAPRLCCFPSRCPPCLRASSSLCPGSWPHQQPSVFSSYIFPSSLQTEIGQCLQLLFLKATHLPTHTVCLSVSVSPNQAEQK